MGILAVILAILAVVAAFFAPLLFGTVGGVVAIVLGVGAAVLGYLKRKKDGKGGIGTIVIGVLAIVLSITMISATNSLVVKLKDEMIKSTGDKYLVARKYAEKADTGTGFMGFINSMLSNVSEEDKEQLEKELQDMAALVSDSMDGAAEKVEEKKDEITDAVENTVDKIEEKADEVSENVGEKVEEITENLDEAVSGDEGN